MVCRVDVAVERRGRHRPCPAPAALRCVEGERAHRQARWRCGDPCGLLGDACDCQRERVLTIDEGEGCSSVRCAAAAHVQVHASEVCVLVCGGALLAAALHFEVLLVRWVVVERSLGEPGLGLVGCRGDRPCIGAGVCCACCPPASRWRVCPPAEIGVEDLHRVLGRARLPGLDGDHSHNDKGANHRDAREDARYRQEPLHF